MKTFPALLLALASVAFFTLVVGPAVSRAEPQLPPDDDSLGLDRTERELGALGRLAEMPELGTRQRAIRAYNRGLEYRDKAARLVEQAAGLDDRKAARKSTRAHTIYRKAIGQFRLAIKQVPDFHQALGSLGYVLLETGQYEEALEAYDRALAIGPLYPEAIEERGEVYLGLHQIEEAKSVYEELTHIDSRLADKLLSAMRRWLERQRDDAVGLSPEGIESFAVWIEVRTPKGAP